MLSHLSLGVSDLGLAAAFYDATLGALGYIQLWNSNGGLGYGEAGGNDRLALFSQSEARLAAGPGFHLAFTAPDARSVDAFHAAALVNGGSDEGKPGLRPHYGTTYYAAFVRDPDGHKLEAKAVVPAD
ncbi:MAG: catechol 2,3-dioxygenase-like lactoylglutathione lyase family enzyme [Myxococcota bacterium]|jgi:catechol 2,3-dioxygenase-like lactoylglutathione lyase family enzyme